MTPIEKARNVGPKTGSELRELGIDSLETLKKIGYKKAFLKLISVFPERINVNCYTALYGAEHDINWKEVPLKIKKEAEEIRDKLKPKKNQKRKPY